MNKSNEKDKRIITFYTAEYPDIDPNIRYDYDELVKDGYSVGRMNVSYREDEAKYFFGISMDVSVQDFDYDKIKQKFGFERIPWVNKCTNDMTVFTDGKISVVIKQHEVTHYVKTVVDKMYVFRKKEICKVKTSTLGLNKVLRDVFQRLSGYFPKIGDGYRLSYNMLTTLEDYDKSLELIKHYDMEQPNLFFTINEI